ncbi:MAG: TldD/PmbA family protein [Candidatus Helarchaeota archaeon]
MNYMAQAEKCLKFAEKQDIDHAEVFLTNARTISAEIERGSMKYAREFQDHGISLRAARNGSIGFSFSTNFEEENLKKMVITAVKLSKTGVADPEFSDFAQPSSYPNISGNFDEKIASIDVKSTMDYCLRTASAAEIDKRIFSINIQLICGISERILLNTNGIEVSSEDSAIHLSAQTTAKENSDTSSGFEFQTSRFLKIEPEKVGTNSAKMALQSLHSRNIETGTYPLILHPFAVAVILGNAIGDAANAEAIQYKRSYLTDLKNEELAVDYLNVVDNGLYIDNNGIAGLGTSKFDGEGIPRQKTPLISNGILSNYLYDTYTAGKEGHLSTGNAARGSYRSVPYITISNLEVVGQAGDMESFITEIKDGVLMYYTADRPNIVTGDFSGLISNGFKIKNGEITYPLKQAMIGINMLDLLKQIQAIGRDYRQISQVITPSLYISDVKVAGAK